MLVYFYTINVDKRCTDKNITIATTHESRVTPTAILDCTWKDDTDLLNPTLEVDYFDGIATVNYMYIPDLGHRYYFMNPPVYGAQRCYISGHVDVLQTYRSELLQMTGIVVRSEYDYDLYLNDPEFKAHQFNETYMEYFPNQPFDSFAHSYVLVVAGAMPANLPST